MIVTLRRSVGEGVQHRDLSALPTWSLALERKRREACVGNSANGVLNR